MRPEFEIINTDRRLGEGVYGIVIQAYTNRATGVNFTLGPLQRDAATGEVCVVGTSLAPENVAVALKKAKPHLDKYGRALTEDDRGDYG